MSGAEVFRTYLERFTSGDIDGAAELLADDFDFAGPMLQVRGKTEFLAQTVKLLQIMRGYVITRQWTDGEDVCSLYDFKIETPVGAGSIPMAEWCVVRNGKLLSSRLIFDTAVMNAFMPAND